MDIVERLRGYIAYNTKQSREEDDVMRDAASEIERLRDALNCVLAAQDLGPSEMTAARDKAEAALQQS